MHLDLHVIHSSCSSVISNVDQYQLPKKDLLHVLEIAYSQVYYDYISCQNSAVIRKHSLSPTLMLSIKRTDSIQIDNIPSSLLASFNVEYLKLYDMIGEGGYSKVYLAEVYYRKHANSQVLAAKVDKEFVFVDWELYIYTLVSM